MKVYLEDGTVIKTAYVDDASFQAAFEAIDPDITVAVTVFQEQEYGHIDIDGVARYKNYKIGWQTNDDALTWIWLDHATNLLGEGYSQDIPDAYVSFPKQLRLHNVTVELAADKDRTWD